MLWGVICYCLARLCSYFWFFSEVLINKEVLKFPFVLRGVRWRVNGGFGMASFDTSEGLFSGNVG